MIHLLDGWLPATTERPLVQFPVLGPMPIIRLEFILSAVNPDDCRNVDDFAFNRSATDMATLVHRRARRWVDHTRSGLRSGSGGYVLIERWREEDVKRQNVPSTRSR